MIHDHTVTVSFLFTLNNAFSHGAFIYK